MPSRHLYSRGFEVVDEVEEDVDVDGFGDEGQVTDRECALSIVFTGITRDGDGGNVAEAGYEAELFEQLIAINVGHPDIRDDNVRAIRKSAAQCFCR